MSKSDRYAHLSDTEDSEADGSEPNKITVSIDADGDTQVITLDSEAITADDVVNSITENQTKSKITPLDCVTEATVRSLEFTLQSTHLWVQSASSLTPW